MHGAFLYLPFVIIISSCTHNVNLNLTTEKPIELTLNIEQPIKLDLGADVALSQISPVELSVSKIPPAEIVVALSIDKLPPVELDAGVGITEIPQITLNAKIEGSEKPIKISIPLDKIQAMIGLGGKLHIDGLPGSGSPIDTSGWCNDPPICGGVIPCCE
jgi:hypothetical protein